MASLCREPRPLRKEWGPAKCAVYAARKEFELLVLLSTADEKVVAMARTMGQAAAKAPSGQRNAATPTRPAQARRQVSGDSDRGRNLPARGSKRVKRGQRERRLRQEAANKCQSIVRSFLVRKVGVPAARERAATRAAANSVLGESSSSPVPSSEWAMVSRRERRRRSPSPATPTTRQPTQGCLTVYHDGR